MKKPEPKVKRIQSCVGRSVIEFDPSHIKRMPAKICKQTLRMIGNIIYEDLGGSSKTKVMLIRGALRLACGAAVEHLSSKR